jgi:diadenosine tetraphosphate (Ap4A) HIT family hydrolase
MTCPFCTIPESRIVAQDSLVIVIRDAFPVSPGHTLIIPRRHVATFFEITETERASTFRLLAQEKLKLDAEFSPQGYNIGINDGASAG